MAASAADPCEPHKKRYGSAHPLTITGALALHARAGAPSDADMRCLEKTFNPEDGAIAAAATRALLIVVAEHPAVAIEAAAARPDLYREWTSEVIRYGIHDVNGEARLLRTAIARLLAFKAVTAPQEAARKLLLDGFSAAQPFRLG